MEILRNLLLVPDLLLLIYFGFAALYFLVFTIASRFYREKTNTGTKKNYKVAIIIPSFKEDSVIVDTAKSAMQHKSNYCQLEVMVIADSLKPETVDEIKNTGAKVLPVTFKKSTKSKSINEALKVISTKTDYVVVLDADNIMAGGFIDNITGVLEQGYKIIQGHRTAKNKNTDLAILDGISEEVNNTIFREGHRVLGLSASLIGSGFACEYTLFKELMIKARAVGGFDKELELMLLERKITIGYAKKAIVYDEKIQKPEAFINQRRRWLSAQFIYFGKNISNGVLQLFKNGNIDYFDKLIQFLVPPRILTIGLAFILTLIHLSILFINNNEYTNLLFYAWAVLSIISSLAVILAIPSGVFNIRTLKALLTIPKGFF